MSFSYYYLLSGVQIQIPVEGLLAFFGKFKNRLALGFGLWMVW
jgi:hypothetical protein